MSEMEKNAIEIPEEALEELDAAGGATATVNGKQYKIITGITKKCSKFNKGPNNYKAIAIKGTCAQCRYMWCAKGYQLCKLSEIE